MNLNQYEFIRIRIFNQIRIGLLIRIQIDQFLIEFEFKQKKKKLSEKFDSSNSKIRYSIR
ncbi:hypothetical protein HanIR_Chr16g0788681 [Helianthus annuus]|nr:hypothetical protein HanIR_Chr16g0788681 [Helianthus annuus]